MSTPTSVVQLNGTIDSERTKQRATELACQVEDVSRGVNNFKVQA
jgi:osmotically-inducible protein OsmY